MSDHELSPAARALLDAARAGMGPDAAAIQRVRGKVAASVKAGAAGAIALKRGIVALVATLAVGAAVLRAPDPQLAGSQIALPTASRERTPPAIQPAAASATIEMDPEAMTRPSVARGDRLAAASTARTASRPRIAPPAASADLAREVELIDIAMTALRRGDPAKALTTVRLHASETRGAGQLAEDAAAIEVEARCRLHDPAVTTRLAAFEARFPRSAQRSRLTSLCSPE